MEVVLLATLQPERHFAYLLSQVGQCLNHVTYESKVYYHITPHSC
jgi:hypothetical protein